MLKSALILLLATTAAADDTCSDKVSPDGTHWWVTVEADSCGTFAYCDGTPGHCQGDINWCDTYGSTVGQGGMSANQACCACGGGARNSGAKPLLYTVAGFSSSDCSGDVLLTGAATTGNGACGAIEGGLLEGWSIIISGSSCDDSGMSVYLYNTTGCDEKGLQPGDTSWHPELLNKCTGDVYGNLQTCQSISNSIASNSTAPNALAVSVGRIVAATMAAGKQ